MAVHERISTADDQGISEQSSSRVPDATSSAVADLTAPPVPPSQSFNQNLPFADFTGRCFLFVCLWGDTLASLARPNRSSVGRIESATSKRREWPRAGRLRSFLGAAAWTLAAASLVPIFSTSAYRPLGLLMLLTVISFIAVRFGNMAGVAGTLCAALLFAAPSFGHRPALAINNLDGRNHLISIVILGVCASELLGRRKGAKGA